MVLEQVVQKVLCSSPCIGVSFPIKIDVHLLDLLDISNP